MDIPDSPCEETPGRSVRAQSVYTRLWKSRHGPIPKGRTLMHRCDNPRCCRLDHIKLGTPRENTRDCIEKGRFKFHPENLTPYHPNPGERNGRAKLTDAQIEEIRASHDSGVELARRYRVTPTRICQIRKRGDRAPKQ